MKELWDNYTSCIGDIAYQVAVDGDIDGASDMFDAAVETIAGRDPEGLRDMFRGGDVMMAVPGPCMELFDWFSAAPVTTEVDVTIKIMHGDSCVLAIDWTDVNL